MLVDQNKVPQWIVTVFPTVKPYAKISPSYPLGADYVGRDLFSRIVYGSRVSLSVAFIGPLISLIVGVIYGSISGLFRRARRQHHDAHRGRAVRLSQPAVHHPADGLLPGLRRPFPAGHLRLRA